jgi:hypothetical protein
VQNNFGRMFIQRQRVSDIVVENCFGYELFQYKTLGKTVKIDIDGKLIWQCNSKLNIMLEAQ